MLQAIDYACDGTRLTGWLADGSGGRPAPGVLVAHEAPGINPGIKARLRRLADLGYVAFASDMYGDSGMHGESGFPVEEARRRHEELMAAPGLMLRRARAALDLLAAQPNVDGDRLAAIGYCQGGIVALELARAGAPIRCAAGFHPGLTRPAGSPDGPISAKVLMMIGNDDPVVPMEDRIAFAQSMDAAGADWQLHVFGGVVHSFTSPEVDELAIPGLAYDACADRRSWAMMLALLEECFGTDGQTP